MVYNVELQGVGGSLSVVLSSFLGQYGVTLCSMELYIRDILIELGSVTQAATIIYSS